MSVIFGIEDPEDYLLVEEVGSVTCLQVLKSGKKFWGGFNFQLGNNFQISDKGSCNGTFTKSL